jgi:hypothetical protein
VRGRGIAATLGGLAVLAVPATVWIAAGAAQVAGDCDIDCGDRDRGYFLLVLVTAPLIPLGMAVLAPRPLPAVLLRLGRLVCLLACGAFVLLGLALAAGGIGALVDVVERNYPVNLDDPAGSRRTAITDVVLWMLAALWCFGVALGTLVVGRRLRRRYPSGSWPPSGKSTSAG